jgi:hypothetical protein
MVQLSVKDNIAATVGKLRANQKQVRFAASVALNKTARLAKDEAVAVMKRSFDRPTPFTLRSLFIKPSTKANLQAMVYVKDQAAGGKSKSLAESLGHEFSGGTRIRKRLELWLERAGYISSNEFVVPGAAAKLDQYGNMSRGQIQQILSQLRAGSDPTAFKSSSVRSKRNVAKSGGIFWSRGGKLPRGAWMRYGFAAGNAVKPLLLVINSPVYKRRVNLPEITRRVIARNFEREFKKAFEMAMSTAR